MAGLTPVVAVDPEKCLNCHACIAVCPVKFCNDGSGDFIALNDSLCIGCGSCIQACTHGARRGLDDGDAFFRDVGTYPFVGVAAPAIASSFPGQYLRINGWVKTLGVHQVFDVSFGAELTVRSYLEHIKNSAPKAVVAQPCPAIVTYIQIYQPELIPYLAPADSPMAHTIRMVREFYPEFKDHRVLVLSPCMAKRREFDELEFGDTVYNVTFKTISDHLKINHIDLNDFQENDYGNPAAERAVLFSSPGGLQRTLERESPEAARATRKIEGPRTVYPYLAKLKSVIDQGTNPLLVDCLNCELGCNGGPGTLNHGKTADEVEYSVEERSRKARNSWKKRGLNANNRSLKTLRNVINRFWKPKLYDRKYRNLSENQTQRVPNPTEREAVYRKMLKFGAQDMYNCNSCGYGECQKMADAIFNGLNKPENCHHYNISLVKIETEKVRTEEEKLTKIIQENKTVTDAIETIVVQMVETNRVLSGKTARMTELNTLEQQRNQVIIRKLEPLSASINSLDTIVKAILDLARKSNILALNATIEASRAGNAGRAFSVVADEVRRMSAQTKDEAQKIQPFAEELKRMMELFINEINLSFQGFIDQAAQVKDISAVAAEIRAIASELEVKASQISQG